MKEKIAAYIKQGAMQLSRRYRHIGVPPVLPKGETYFDLVKRLDPLQYERLEQRAKELVVHYLPETHIELTFEEFNEWLLETGRTPVGNPPEPYKTWGEYHRSKQCPSTRS